MIGMLSTFLGLGLAVYVSLEAYSQGGLFAWHPFLMTFGSLFLSAAGIQAVRSRHRVGRMASKTQRVQVCVCQPRDVFERAGVCGCGLESSIAYRISRRQDRMHVSVVVQTGSNGVRSPGVTAAPALFVLWSVTRFLCSAPGAVQLLITVRSDSATTSRESHSVGLPVCLSFSLLVQVLCLSCPYSTCASLCLCLCLCLSCLSACLPACLSISLSASSPKYAALCYPSTAQP